MENDLRSELHSWRIFQMILGFLHISPRPLESLRNLINSRGKSTFLIKHAPKWSFLTRVGIATGIVLIGTVVLGSSVNAATNETLYLLTEDTLLRNNIQFGCVLGVFSGLNRPINYEKDTVAVGVPSQHFWTNKTCPENSDSAYIIVPKDLSSMYITFEKFDPYIATTRLIAKGSIKFEELPDEVQEYHKLKYALDHGVYRVYDVKRISSLEEDDKPKKWYIKPLVALVDISQSLFKDRNIPNPLTIVDTRFQAYELRTIIIEDNYGNRTLEIIKVKVPMEPGEKGRSPEWYELQNDYATYSAGINPLLHRVPIIYFDNMEIPIKDSGKGFIPFTEDIPGDGVVRIYLPVHPKLSKGHLILFTALLVGVIVIALQKIRRRT